MCRYFRQRPNSDIFSDVKRGDLIRSSDSYNFINLVLEVGPSEPTGKRLNEFQRSIRSVRYGKTNRHSFTKLNGRRVRPFLINNRYSDWKIVEEYLETEVDNSNIRTAHLALIDELGEDVYQKGAQ